jgi:tetratricopeptide (TPR) repeat protein
MIPIPLTERWRDIDHLVADCRESLDDLMRRDERLEAAAARNCSLGELEGYGPIDYTAMYGAAVELHKSGDIDRAMAVAMQLVALEGRDPRYLYLAATCLRQTRDYAGAAAMYEACVALRPPMAPALFWAGECHVRAAETQSARRAYEAAVEAARGNESMRITQERAQAALDALACAA